jgi:hypothetical protein
VGKLAKNERKKTFYDKLPPKMNFSQKALYKIFPKISPWSKERFNKVKIIETFSVTEKKTWRQVIWVVCNKYASMQFHTIAIYVQTLNLHNEEPAQGIYDGMDGLFGFRQPK